MTLVQAKVSTSLARLATRINAAHEAFEGSTRDSFAYAVEAGELLVQAKESLAHGDWLPWLKENFMGSQPTASRYMTLASRATELEANYSRVNSLSLRGALKLLNKDANANGLLLPPPDDEPTEVIDAEPLEPETVGTTDLSTLIGQRFGTIYADPPWRYSNQSTRASTDNHYETMPVEEIAALPIAELAADRAHLWLWTTNGFLFECPRLFEAWGFEFKSSYVWVKPKMGIGNYLRNSHELLLLAARGGLTAAKAARDVMSWGEFPRGEHSAKPHRIRTEVVERVSPGPRLELFGRALSHGWTVWGNQINRTMFDVSEVG